VHIAASVFHPRRSKGAPLLAVAPRKLLVLESHLIGDTVLLVPILQALKDKYPNAELHVLGNPWIKDVLDDLRLVDRFILQKIPWATYDYSASNLRRVVRTIKLLRAEHYDLAIDPRGDARNAVLLWTTNAKRRLGFGMTGASRYLTDIAPAPAEKAPLLEAKYKVLEPLGIYGPPNPPAITCPPSAYEAGRVYTQALRQRHGGRIVGFHAMGSQRQRQLSHTKQLEIGRALIKAGIVPILIGGPTDKLRLSAIRGELQEPATLLVEPLTRTMGVLANVDALIGVDSGPAHLAAALGTPTVVIVEAHKLGITTPRGRVFLLPASSDKSFEDLAAAEVLHALAALGVLAQAPRQR
jgi:ADP-heptose:LPS heptosyltransferase